MDGSSPICPQSYGCVFMVRSKVVFGHVWAEEDCIVACLAAVQGPNSYVRSSRCEEWFRVRMLLAGMVPIVRLAELLGCCKILRHFLGEFRGTLGVQGPFQVFRHVWRSQAEEGGVSWR